MVDMSDNLFQQCMCQSHALSMVKSFTSISYISTEY